MVSQSECSPPSRLHLMRTPLGVIAESAPKRTLSVIEERRTQISQGRTPLFERFGRPDVVAIEADVLPAERSDVGEQLVGQRFALAGCSPRRRYQSFALEEQANLAWIASSRGPPSPIKKIDNAWRTRIKPS